MFWLRLSANICTIFVNFQHQQMFNETCLFDWSLLTPRLSAATDWKLTNWPSSPVQVCCSSPIFVHADANTVIYWVRQRLCDYSELAKTWEITHLTIPPHPTPFHIINTYSVLTEWHKRNRNFSEDTQRHHFHSIRPDLHYNLQAERGRLSTTSVDPVQWEQDS